MHDLTYAKEIINALSNKKKTMPQSSKIIAINASLSPLSHVKPETLTETFKVMTKGTEFEQIPLNIIVSKLGIKCRSCGHAFYIDKPVTNCIKCDGSDLDIIISKEFQVESIQLQ